MYILIRVGFVIVLTAFAVGCTNIKCEGYPQAVCDKCGENPAEVRTLKRMKETGISDFAKAEATECVSAYVKAQVNNTEQADIALNGCLTNKTKLDPASRDMLLKIVDDAITDSSLQPAIEAWHTCYKKNLGS